MQPHIAPNLICVLLFSAVATGGSALAPPDWRSATVFPPIEHSSLSASDWQVVLDFVREHGCTCGCTMKIAECAILDPQCQAWPKQIRAAITAVGDGMRGEALAIAVHRAAPPLPVREAPEDPSLGPEAEINVPGLAAIGPAAAPVRIVAFIDFADRVSRSADLRLASLAQEFRDRMRVEYIPLPCPDDDHSMMLAAAAIAADAQGKYWILHRLAFALEPTATFADLLSQAAEAGLDAGRIRLDIDHGVQRARLSAFIDEAGRLAVAETPSMWIDGRRYSGRLSGANLRATVNERLRLAGLSAMTAASSERTPAVSDQPGQACAHGPHTEAP